MNKKLSTEYIEKTIADINNLSHYNMCYLWRFASPGHEYFDGSLPFYKVFKKRFDEFGGFTPEISKSLGWEK